MKKFDISLADSQAVEVSPIKPEAFDLDAYALNAAELNRNCEKFWEADSGVLVYRRMRVAECFSFGCRDMKRSLELQLGSLEKSKLFKADVPNFLEPWYGIGTLASAFGSEYNWPDGNAPVIKPRFSSLDEVLKYQPKPVAETNIGKHTLNMIGYFLEKTKGKIPVSFTDSQSPLNSIANLLPLDQFFIEVLMNPDNVRELFDILAGLSIEFNKKQAELIGDALVLPGHGFASSTKWKGLGLSDDNAIMISPDDYALLAVPSVKKVCDPFGGAVFHSCGDWSAWIDAVLNIDGIKMADAAFSPQTDPGATDNLEAFHRFAGTGVVLNARIVGDLKTIEEQVKRLWVPGMKLVVVTYCETPAEQELAYNRIHEICN
ncbi:uroporphyrinogen decarboxylase family protein [uncultured Draconibacterium sp.]|uniref:uroporphyrinogen decarboxylase family protein n=1 Tax=uncultured Draconibacterium sp. TaxID=1573823 RepID=UPI003218056A